MGKNVEKIYKEISSFSRSEKISLLLKLVLEIYDAQDSNRKLDIYNIKGIGKEIWKDIDAQEYVNKERSLWR